jgi:anti-anti-sigma regulatory factor
MEGDLNLSPANGRGPAIPFGQKPDVSTSTLPPILDLTQAKPLHETLTALLDQHTVILDAAAVERMSTPCAQVLLAVGRAAVAAGASFLILNPSAVFGAALADLGLQPEFSKWMG